MAANKPDVVSHLEINSMVEKVRPPTEIFFIIGWLTNLNGWLAG
jgi:hypothetical protein